MTSCKMKNLIKYLEKHTRFTGEKGDFIILRDLWKNYKKIKWKLFLIYTKSFFIKWGGLYKQTYKTIIFNESVKFTNVVLFITNVNLGHLMKKINGIEHIHFDKNIIIDKQFNKFVKKRITKLYKLSNGAGMKAGSTRWPNFRYDNNKKYQRLKTMNIIASSKKHHVGIESTIINLLRNDKRISCLNTDYDDGNLPPGLIYGNENTIYYYIAICKQ